MPAHANPKYPLPARSTAHVLPLCLGVQERTSFYQWRRELASLEQDERLVLTPFEKVSCSLSAQLPRCTIC